jgi:hypothetical protein
MHNLTERDNAESASDFIAVPFLTIISDPF